MAINEKRSRNLMKVVLMEVYAPHWDDMIKMNKHSIASYSISHKEGIHHSSVESHTWTKSADKAER